jgi:secondary thiamine-phosphate synthase enzyme
MESHFNRMIPENAPYYTHTFEGPDDMPAHIKASVLDNSLSIPITGGKLNLGTWQGIYLCEHRDHAPGRRIVVTLFGEGEED